MNGEQKLKKAIFAPMTDEQLKVYILTEAEKELVRDKRDNLTREQQLEKALRFATGMLGQFMTQEQQRDNLTLGYICLVNKPTV
jgi:hypothetical protein